MGAANEKEFLESLMDYLLGKCTKVIGRSVQGMGSFTNYVYRFLDFFDPLPPG